MAQQFYKVDLRNASVELRVQDQTRTIIGASVGRAPSQEDGVSIAYMKNVLPTREGYESVGYQHLDWPAIDPAPSSNIVKTHTIYNEDKVRCLLSVTSLEATYAYNNNPGSPGWNAVVPAGGFFEPPTIGTVNGVTYVASSKAGLGAGTMYAYTLAATLTTLTQVTLTGLDSDEILGITASSGYLVAYTDTALAWSSTIDPTDFVPSAVTGAGGGIVAGLRGPIVGCYPIAGGFIIYTAYNAIGATYTGNPSFPFKFKEIAGCNGSISSDGVAHEGTHPAHYVGTEEGIQKVTLTSAESFLPEIQDFINWGYKDSYDENTGVLSVVSSGWAGAGVLRLSHGRYLMIGYPDREDILVYDMLLSKWGKLAIEFADIIDVSQGNTLKGPAAVLTTGQILMITPETQVNPASPLLTNGIIILGKLQTSYSRMFKLLEVQVENVEDAATFDCRSRPSLDGKTMVATGEVAGTLATTAEPLRAYKFYSTAKNHSLVFTGAFNLTTALVTFANAGKR